MYEIATIGWNGVKVSDWTLRPFCVDGGVRIALVRWVLEPDGWDMEHRFADPRIFPDDAACQKAIDARRGPETPSRSGSS